MTVPEYASQTGRVIESTTTAGSLAQVTEWTYDDDGKAAALTVDGETTPPSYTADGELAGVAYPGGATLAVTRDGAGRIVGQDWTFPNADPIADTVVRSQSGRAVRHAITRSGSTFDFVLGYDAAGRLVTADIPGHALTYEFDGQAACGPNTAAGRSGNRTGLIDAYLAPGEVTPVVTTTEYCYDWADRLLSTQVTGPVADANSVAGGLDASDVEYNEQGSVTRLGDMVFSYDAANRHAGTV